MRTYLRNSPEAAARVVALALLADNHVSRDEMNAVRRFDIPGRLDLSHQAFMGVVQTLCDELLSESGHIWQGVQHLPQGTLHQVLDEVDDIGLRLIVLQLCAAVAESDRHLAEGESRMLHTVADHWDLPRPAFAPIVAGAPRRVMARVA
ncbi:TerB family tellurite resistance protein [Aquabacterium sp.]|jgi:hypothetical protein|uniref:tellurite resistance TerB family protein n=1 Tax=Aquabacterium sp. TaxID=1872578 RepID=UPI0025BD3B96|nr:TerB family tellurite resistance protein [Aquabacterium sp.]